MEEKKYVASDFTDSPITKHLIQAFHKDGVTLSELEEVDIKKINPLTANLKTLTDIWVKQDIKRNEEIRIAALSVASMEEENNGENL